MPNFEKLSKAGGGRKLPLRVDPRVPLATSASRAASGVRDADAAHLKDDLAKKDLQGDQRGPAWLRARLKG